MQSLAAALLVFAAFLAQFRPEITSPRPGEALRGVVTIIGTADAVGFVGYELTFAYPDDQTGTWFLIAQSNQPVQGGTLGEWDTTLVADGEYLLRLRVLLDDGSSLEVLVAGLRVRNYTPVETPTSAPTPLFPTPTPPVAPLLPVHTPTPLPPNPAALTPERLRLALGGGMAGMFALLTFLAAYLALRRRL